MFCRDAVLVNHAEGRAQAHVLYCRSWSCPICAPRRRYQVTLEIQEGAPERLLTLTVLPSRGLDQTDRAQTLVKNFRTLMRLAKKRYGYEEFEYFAVMEAQKSGEPHLHVALRCGWLDYAWIKRTWEDLTGAWNVDIRKIFSPTKCANYVAKYLGKDLHKFSGCKRYWRSIGYLTQSREERKRERRRTGEWHRANIGLKDWVALWRYAGWRVETDGDTARAVDPDRVQQMSDAA
jgi:hypothetical protein